MSKFYYESFYGGYDDFAVSKEKYTKEEAIEIARDYYSNCEQKYLIIGTAWVRHRAGVNEDHKPCVGWWIEYKDTGRNCPAWVFRRTSKCEISNSDCEYISIRVTTNDK